MVDRVAVRCRCGAVEGSVADASPRTVNRVICYCADCQAFAHHLGQADLLDAHGGSDVVQIPPASLTFSRGTDRISGLRLSPKGLFRFYANCCNTPIGNVFGPRYPFIGIVVQAFCADAKNLEEALGHARGAIHGKHAIGGWPEGATTFDPGLIARALFLIVAWRLQGRNWPHPFFDRATRMPIYPVTILPHEQREALRCRKV